MGIDRFLDNWSHEVHRLATDVGPTELAERRLFHLQNPRLYL
jgi:hypothetical protein